MFTRHITPTWESQQQRERLSITRKSWFHYQLLKNISGSTFYCRWIQESGLTFVCMMLKSPSHGLSKPKVWDQVLTPAVTSPRHTPSPAPSCSPTRLQTQRACHHYLRYSHLPSALQVTSALSSSWSGNTSWATLMTVTDTALFRSSRHTLACPLRANSNQTVTVRYFPSIKITCMRISSSKCHVCFQPKQVYIH